jgi:hypothetical protein
MQTNASPAAPAAPAAIQSLPGSDAGGGPATVAEIAALRSRRKELSDQLISATDRRNTLAQEIQSASGASKVGLEQRIAVLDKRIVQLESDIASTGRELTSAAAGRLTTETGSASVPRIGVLSSGEITAISIVFTVLVLFPLAIAAARLMWRRAKQPVVVPAIQGESAQRLERLEQAVESVAIEVERISEGQRFVTRLLSSSPQPGALPSVQKETVAVKISD